MNTFIIFVEKLQLRTKLMAGFSAGLLLALILGLNTLSIIADIKAETQSLYEKDLLGVTAMKDANLNLIYMSRAMRQMLIAQDAETRDRALATIKAKREKLLEELADAKKGSFRPHVLAQFAIEEAHLNKAFEGIEHAVALIEREQINPSPAAQFITSKEFGLVIAAADDGLHTLSDLKEQGAKDKLTEIQARSKRAQVIATMMLGGGLVLAIGLGMLIMRSISRPNERLRASIEHLAGGKVDQPIAHTDYHNEIGTMARAVSVLQGIYRQSNDQHWVKSHVSELNTALQAAQDFISLAQTTVSQISPAIGAGHGAMYVADRENRFTLLGSYGYRERKHLSNSFGIGEGLVGQAAMEKKPITLTAPQNYIQINSGLGEGPPACISVLPIIHQDRVLAVLEVASFKQFSEREVALLDALVPALAVSMEIMDRNQRTKELLASTQQQAERMEKQAAQLEEQTVEMEAQQAELLETENWFRSIIETAPDGMLVVDAQGRILLANPQSGNLLGYAAGELVGTDFAQRMPSLALNGSASVLQYAVDARRKDGSAISLDVSCSPLPDRGGRGKCVSVVVRQHVQASGQGA